LAVSEVHVTAADLHTFDRIKGQLDAFDLGMTPIPDLVTSVGQLLDQFEDVPPTYAEELRQLWWPLQYALALSRDQERSLTGDEEQEVRDTVAVLAQQIADLHLH
jgi:hypothetical protein